MAAKIPCLDFYSHTFDQAVFFVVFPSNIQSERVILKRQTRSIQTEGHFGDIKENENFRRFNYRSADKVYKEFMLSAIGRNINKYCRFLNEKLKKFEGKTTEKTA